MISRLSVHMNYINLMTLSIHCYIFWEITEKQWIFTRPISNWVSKMQKANPFSLWNRVWFCQQIIFQKKWLICELSGRRGSSQMSDSIWKCLNPWSFETGAVGAWMPAWTGWPGCKRKGRGMDKVWSRVISSLVMVMKRLQTTGMEEGQTDTTLLVVGVTS